MDTMQIVITVAISVLTITSVVVAVYVIQVLQRVKNTLDKVNLTLDVVEDRVISLTNPLQSLVGMSASLGTGLRVFESFVGWLNRGKGKERV